MFLNRSKTLKIFHSLQSSSLSDLYAQTLVFFWRFPSTASIGIVFTLWLPPSPLQVALLVNCQHHEFVGIVFGSGVMEDGENILSVIQEDDLLDDIDDVDMLDVEEGELVEVQTSHIDVNTSTSDVNISSTITKTCKRGKKKKKNRKKKSIPGSGVTDVNRLVLNVCGRLKERKSYLVYAAVGCLGVSAFCDLVKEVDAIQACGGQQTANGKRFRTGGGILWNILKIREPNAYKEIMKKGKEFEKQFRQTRTAEAKTDEAIQTGPSTAGSEVKVNPIQKENEHDEANPEEKRVSVHERMRVPVSYDDLLGDEVPTSI